MQRKLRLLQEDVHEIDSPYGRCEEPQVFTKEVGFLLGHRENHAFLSKLQREDKVFLLNTRENVRFSLVFLLVRAATRLLRSQKKPPPLQQKIRRHPPPPPPPPAPLPGAGGLFTPQRSKNNASRLPAHPQQKEDRPRTRSETNKRASRPQQILPCTQWKGLPEGAVFGSIHVCM